MHPAHAAVPPCFKPLKLDCMKTAAIWTCRVGKININLFFIGSCWLRYGCRSICGAWPAASIQIYFWGAIEAPRGYGPSPENFFWFRISTWRFVVHSWCNFCSSSKTFRGRKDTLAQVYFYWGQSPPPPGIDATVLDNSGLASVAASSRAYSFRMFCCKTVTCRQTNKVN